MRDLDDQRRPMTFILILHHRTNSDGGRRGHGQRRSTIATNLPELGANLVPALPCLNVNDFSHNDRYLSSIEPSCCGRTRTRWRRASKKSRLSFKFFVLVFWRAEEDVPGRVLWN